MADLKRLRLLALVLLAGAVFPAAPAFAQPDDALRSIAIAEDQRRWADGELKRFLGHADPVVRARAALAVGRLQDSVTVADLAPLTRDASAEVRREAAFALGQIGHRSAREPLEAALADPDTAVVTLAIEALGKLGDHASTARVVSFLSSRNAAWRGEAAVALWRLADSTAVGALLARHRDPDPEVRWRVLYALEKVVSPGQIVLPVALHLEDAEWLSRAYAARTLGRQKSSRATAYLVQRCSDMEPAVAVNAIRALQQIGDSTSSLCAVTLRNALKAPVPDVRVTAATALAERFFWVPLDSTDRRSVLDTLALHLADPDAATRGACARALLAIEGEAALDRVRPLLSDSSRYTRAAVIVALSRLPAARVEPLLLPLLAPSAELFDRMNAAEALGTARSRAALGALRAGLADSAMLFAAACAGALAEAGDSASVKALAAAYGARAADADADARISIRDALRTLAGRAYADSIERLHPPRNAAPPTYDADFHRAPQVKGARLLTSAGVIEWAFLGDQAPQTVRNFVRLAERGYFDGLSVHRVVPNFVMQDGDPTGTGSGGPGYTIRCEYNRLCYEPGMVGMALSGKDTGGSQWFITHSPQPHLNGRYTIFARVTRGLDVVRRVVQGDRVLRVEILR